jgi:H/ACA ribonucleoprotein complex subunit 3
MNIYVNGKRLTLKPNQVIGKGGEADVFEIGNGKALKLFKPPHHLDYQGSPQAQQAARDRLVEHQQKLRQFPKHLPDRVIQPEQLVTDKTGQQILGYTMPLLKDTEVLLKYGDRTFRQAGVTQKTVVQIFQDLHTTVSKLHFAQVVIGDFNDLNILIQGNQAYLIDADSFQFGSFLCKVFTARFVDPLLCQPQATQPILQAPYREDSDWYAFTVMLMQSLLFVHPYGGIYQPHDPAQKIPHDSRPLHRITVFHPQVRYPKPALPYKLLPDQLLHHFHQVFEHDRRGEFPRSLLDHWQWTTCNQCGTEHARQTCPHCTQITVKTVPEVTVVRGNISVTRICTTTGVILQATLQGDRLHWLEYTRGAFQREDGSVILHGDLTPQLKLRLQGSKTLIGQHGQVVILNGDRILERFAVDRYRQSPVFEVNATYYYWVNNGQLLRNGQLGTEYIGDVLAGQTRFWVGSSFGFGFYQAAELNVGFVFDAQRRGINDRVPLPRCQGQLIDATCVFSPDYCWFFSAWQQQGQRIHRCIVIDQKGTIVAQTESEPTRNHHWLATLSGKCANQTHLLAATDDGIVKLGLHQGRIIKIQEFPDTEPFVDSNSQLFATQSGLFVVNQSEIQFLKMSSSAVLTQVR